jgi:regulation of enolase protein 1 (concanavalin A-like superfamily)
VRREKNQTMYFAKRWWALACASLLGWSGLASVATAAPVVVGANGSPGVHGPGRQVACWVTFSEDVTVTGTPTIGVRIGSTLRQFTFRSVLPNPRFVEFNYQVQAGDNGTHITAGPIALNGGTIKGADGSDATLTFAPIEDSDVIYDTTAPAAPVISGVTPASPTSEQSFTLAGTAEPGSTVVFRTGSVGRAVADAAGNWSVTFGPRWQGSYAYGAIAQDPAGNRSALGSFTVNVQPGTPAPGAPVVTRVDPPADGYYGQGYEWYNHYGMSITVVMSSPVLVTGLPTLGIRVGSVIRQTSPPINASSTTPTTHLIFKYGPQFGDPHPVDADSGSLTITGPIELHGGTIRAEDGTNASLAFATVEAPGVIIDTVEPDLAINAITPASPTAAQAFTISGTTEPGASVTSLSASHPAVTADASGNWSMTFPARAAGTYTMRFEAEDAAGNPWVGPGIPQPNGTPFTFTVQPEPAAVWTSTNIGAATGSATYSGSQVSVAGSGADIWDTADAFHFHHRSLSGDGSIVARVTNFADAGTHPWAKAGLMFRESTAPNSRHVSVLLTRSNGTVTHSRQSPGAITGMNWGNETPGPYWLKVARAGNTFIGYDSTDGVTWEELTRVTINEMPSTVLAGLAVTSHEAGVQRTAIFNNVLVSGPAGPPPAAPSGLQATLVSATEVELRWIDNSSDETGFLLERAVGSGSFAQIATPAANSTRASDVNLDPGTTYHYRVSAFSNGGSSAYSATATVTTPPASGTPPNAPSGVVAEYWANRIEIRWADNSNNETTFAIERSTDGTTFQSIGSVPGNVTGYADTNLFGETRQNYSYRVRAVNGSGSSASSPVATVEVVGNRPNFATRNIGIVNPSGRMAFNSNGSWSVVGGGADIWGNADAFTFESRPWNGDGEFVARVHVIEPTNEWAKAGIMIREGLEPNSRNVFVAATPSNGYILQTRTSVGASTNFGARAPGVAPVWLKLTRMGNEFRAYRSADGLNWTDFGTLTLSLSGPLEVGLAVTSHAPGSVSTARFSDTYFGPVRSTPPALPAAPSGLQATAASPNQVDLRWTDNSSNETGFHVERATGSGPFTVLVTVGANVTQYQDSSVAANTTYSYRVAAHTAPGDSPYSNIASTTTPTNPGPPPGPGPIFATSNIGTVNPAGSTTYDSGTATWSVSGGGADIWNNADAFTYQYQSWSGDGEFVARVQSLDFTHEWAKAGLMFRETLDPQARNIFLAVTAGNGVELQSRTSTGGSTSFLWREITPAPLWFKLTRLGHVFTAAYSTDGQLWRPMGSYTYEMQSSIFVGLAVTSHAPGTLSTARFSDVYLGAIRDGATSPPTAPTNLTAIARSFSSADLQWTDNASNESGFRIERSTDNVTFAMLTTLAPNVTSHTDNTLSSATTYYYRVRAFNSAGTSGFATASVTTPSVTTTPLNGPSGLLVTSATATQIDLRWADNDTSEMGFQVERSTDGATFALLRTVAHNEITLADTTVMASIRYFYRVRAVRGSDVSPYSNVVSATAANPTWFGADIGAVGVAGSNATAGNMLTLRGSGADIWGAADGFYFRYQRITGNFVVEAQVTLTHTHDWAKAGVMVREDTTAAARNVFTYVTPTNDTYMQFRRNPGQETSFAAFRFGTPRPYWVRLARNGNSMTASSSADGVTWQVMDTYEVVMSADVLVGFAVTSHNNAVLNTATFTNPSIR